MSKNPKNRGKLMKIANIDREFISERLEEIQWKFQERCVLRCFKSHKKTGFHHLFRRYIFRKTTGEGSV